jgi:hypothetical protein
MTENDKAEQQLVEATGRVHRAQIELGLASAARDGLVLQYADDIPRRRMAALTDLTPGRIQQIIGKTKAELGETTHRVVVRTQHGDALRSALADEPDLILFGGHGSGTAAPGSPLPPIDTWSIYVRAEDDLDARTKVEAALSKTGDGTPILSVDPFDPKG